jgi:hypothetical protein
MSTEPTAPVFYDKNALPWRLVTLSCDNQVQRSRTGQTQAPERSALSGAELPVEVPGSPNSVDG